MEGLIPFVIHAFKDSRKKSKYRSLSDESSFGSGGFLMNENNPLAAASMKGWEDGASSSPQSRQHLRRARSQYKAPRYEPSQYRGSRSLREKPRPPFVVSPRNYS